MIQPAVTVFTSDRAPLAKRFSVVGGAIHKESLATLYAGEAETRPARTASELAALLDGLNFRQALAAGRLVDADRARIGTRAKATEGERARTLADFTFPKAPGWLLWDYDAKSMPPEVAARVAALGGPLAALFHLWPEAAAGPYVIRPSSSDGVTAPGCGTIESAGLHGLFLIADVSQSRATLETLQARAWAEGLAWCALSKSGAVLVRSIVDVAVGSPERLIFEAAPILVAPVTRHPRQTIVQDAPAPLAIPGTPLEVAARAARQEQTARVAIKPEAQRTEAAFVEARARGEAARTGKPLDEARAAVRQMLCGAALADDHPLQMKDGAWRRVGELLDAPDRFDRLSMPDPVEGLSYGATTATLFLRPRPNTPDDQPALVSHAHGQRTVYRFARYQAPPPPPPRPAPIPPVHPGPDRGASREAGIARARNAIRAWSRRSERMARVSRELAQEVAARVPWAADPKAETRKIGVELRRRYDLPRTPRTAWGKPWPGPRDLVTGGMGLGKTAALVGVQDHRTGERRPGTLHDGLGTVTAFFSPDHDKTSEAFRDYQDNAPQDRPSPAAVHLRGRSAKRPDGLGLMCELADQAEAAAKRGVNVRATMCGICPHREGCAYLEMLAEAEATVAGEAGAVVFSVHDHAFRAMPLDLGSARYVVDERPRDFGLRKAEVELGQWTGEVRHLLRDRSTASVADALADLLALIRPMLVSIARALADDPANAQTLIAAAALRLAEEADKGQPARVLRRVASRLTQFLDQRLEAQIKATMMGPVTGGPGRPPSLTVRLDRAIEEAEDRHVGPMIEVIRAIAREVERGHGGALRTVKLEQRPGKPPRIVAAWIAPATIPAHAPLLALDGTADPDLVPAWFGPDLTHVHCPVERLGEAVFVDGHSFSTTSLTGLTPGGHSFNADRAEDLRKRLLGCLARETRPFLTMAQQALEAMMAQQALPAMPPLPAGLKTAWFGALRGRNKGQDCEVAFIVGRNLPPLRAVEELAAAFAVALGRPFTPLPPPADRRDHRYPRRVEGLRTADGQGHGIMVEFHPDPTGQAVLRQLRDAETTQAVDRVRAMFAPKRIVVMGSSIPDVTFDRIEHWTHFHKGGSKVARALATRVLLLSESLEADVRTDNIWPNRKAAQRDQEFQGLKAALGTDLCLGHPVYRDSIYQMSQANAAAVVASFRLPPTKGRGGPQTPFRALVLASVEEARAVLEGVVGPLAEFTILASTPEARSPARPAPPAPAPAPAPAPVATLLRPPPAAPAVLHVEPKDVPDRRPNRPVWPAVLGARGP